VGILLAGIKFNQTLFQAIRVNQLMIGATALTLGFGFYCYFYLPVWDFLPYKKGNDIDFIMNHIPPGERATDSVEIRFVMQKGSDSVKVTTSQYADFAQKGYVFVRQDRRVIVKGYDSPIHDFAIHDLQNGIDYKDSFLKYSGYQVLFIAPFLSNTDVSCLSDISKLHDFISKKESMKFYALSSASKEASNEFAKKHGLKFTFFASIFCGIKTTSSCSTLTHSTGPIPSGKSKTSISLNGAVVYQPRPSSQTIGGLRHSSIVVQIEKDGAKLWPSTVIFEPSKIVIESIRLKR
jgi:hypothetical protein